ncbi:HCN2 [Symbiodinium sp. CCMP2592]|nr:HCN2 [Symbiodinium sp. CCMP2592]
MSRSSQVLAQNDSEESEIPAARHASPESFWELHRRLAECYMNDMRVHAPQDSHARNLLETAHASTTPSPPAGSPHPLSPLAVSFPEMLKPKNKSASMSSHVALPSPCFSDRLTPERGEFGVPKVAPSPVRRRMSDKSSVHDNGIASRDFGCASRGSSMVSASFTPRRCWLVKNKQPTISRRKSLQAATTTSSKAMDLLQTSNDYKDGAQRPFSLRSFHLNPTGNFRSFWDLLGLCFLVKDVIAIPLQLVNVNLQVFTTYNVVNALALVYWVVDIFLGFVTGLLHKGHLITDRRKICRHYLQTWFFIDVGVTAMDIVLEFGAVDDTVGESATTTRFLRFLRVMRVLRLGKLSQITQFFQDQFETQVASMEFSLIFVMLSTSI